MDFNITKIFHLARHLKCHIGSKSWYLVAHFTSSAKPPEYNYYNLPENPLCSSGGFGENDPRGLWTSTDDALADLRDASDPSLDFNESERLGILKFTRDQERPNRPLDPLDPGGSLGDAGKITRALDELLPEYSSLKDVGDLLHLGKRLNVVGDPLIPKLATLKSLIILKTQSISLKESLRILLIYDHFNLLDYALTSAFENTIRHQLYALGPFDVAAAISIFGKFPDRFAPLLNTLGLVFYDMMIGGPTSACPNGTTREQLLAVARALRDAKFQIKKVTDALFGTIYRRLDEFSLAMLISATESFFAIEKNNSSFVEFYTKVFSLAFNQPLLFVDAFQKYAQEQLKTDFHVPSSDVGILPHFTLPSDPKGFHIDSDSVPPLLKALDACNSEFLISSVHWRIEFKRCWSENFKNDKIPWQPPTSRQKAHATSGTASTSLDKMVTFKSLLPRMYETIERMVMDHVLGNVISSPGKLTRRISDANAKVVEHARKIANASDASKLSEWSHGAHYPYVGTLMKSTLPPEHLENAHEKMPTSEDIKESITAFATAESLEILEIHACNLLARAGYNKGKIVEMSHLGYKEWLTEFATLVGLGASKGFFESVVHAIKVTTDYSRYIDEAKTGPTFNILCNLYHCLLFYIFNCKNPNEAACKRVWIISSICPKSMLLNDKHLVLVNDPGTEYFKTSSGIYYNVPNLVHASLYKGKGDLYGIACYTVGNLLENLNLCDFENANDVLEKIQHLLHPIYAISRVRIDPLEAWSIAHFSSRPFADSIHDLEKLKSIDTIAQAFESDAIRHLFVAFINAAIPFLTGVAPKGVEIQHAKTVVMLQHCINYFQELTKIPNLGTLSILDTFETISVPLDEEEAAEFKIPEHVMLMETIAAALSILPQPSVCYELLTRCLNLAYKRVKYFSTEHLVPTAGAVHCLEAHFNSIELDEFSENLKQLNGIVKSKVLDCIAQNAYLKNMLHFTNDGKRHFMH
ncbi:hypothetical protein BdWA1_003203 [Babesia duncani]|uniref:Uncharacterized protein n=1 Tax=Babesia duncani TaxID=323732 RepID=A0AAD9PJB4_9APIC|nr:hypothetical protein BdWA1_003203 [Babesia duncani]